MATNAPHRIWTVANAKARLSEILRLAETEGPQRIGARRSFVVVPDRGSDRPSRRNSSYRQHREIKLL